MQCLLLCLLWVARAGDTDIHANATARNLIGQAQFQNLVDEVKLPNHVPWPSIRWSLPPSPIRWPSIRFTLPPAIRWPTVRPPTLLTLPPAIWPNIHTLPPAIRTLPPHIFTLPPVTWQTPPPVTGPWTWPEGDPAISLADSVQAGIATTVQAGRGLEAVPRDGFQVSAREGIEAVPRAGVFPTVTAVAPSPIVGPITPPPAGDWVQQGDLVFENLAQFFGPVEQGLQTQAEHCGCDACTCCCVSSSCSCCNKCDTSAALAANLDFQASAEAPSPLTDLGLFASAALKHGVVIG